MDPEEWDDTSWGWDPWTESTIDEALAYACEPKWAEDYLGYPIEQQQSVSVELMEAFWEMRAQQEEYGDDFETVMLREESSILDAMMGNWWLRVP